MNTKKMNTYNFNHILIYKITFFILAVSQIISTFFSSFSGGSDFNELLITPAGYTFAIWGAITVFSCIYALLHLFGDRTFKKQVYLWLSSVYLCFTLWLMAAEREMLFATVLIFLFMYFALLKVFPQILEEGFANFLDKIFLQGGVGMYLGWSSVAVLANIGVYAFSFGVQSNSQVGIYLQILLVILATLSAGYALYKTKRNAVVFATHWWAFIGILAGLFSRENTFLLIACTLLCVVGLNFFYFKKWLGFVNK
jgi:hypothetical protein